jgi:hypothetical protein
MASDTWKAVERKVARFFGAERNPLSGSRSGNGTRSDSLHERLYIETKHRVQHSAVNLWRDTAQKAKRERKAPVVALAERNKPGFWIVVHSSDLASVASEIGENPEPLEDTGNDAGSE